MKMASDNEVCIYIRICTVERGVGWVGGGGVEEAATV